jgi:hypothetical protein
VHFDDNHGPYTRVLFRQKEQLTWKQNLVRRACCPR